jgi:hypothetical protein
MRRRTFLLYGGIIVVVIGAGLYCLGLYWNSQPTGEGANIGAGVALLFGEFVGAMGLCILMVWAIAALIVKVRDRSSSHR